MTMLWKTTRYQVDLSQPQVMGIVNVTPDSFSDGGRLADDTAALRHCEQCFTTGPWAPFLFFCPCNSGKPPASRSTSASPR